MAHCSCLAFFLPFAGLMKQKYILLLLFVNTNIHVFIKIFTIAKVLLFAFALL